MKKKDADEIIKLVKMYGEECALFALKITRLQIRPSERSIEISKKLESLVNDDCSCNKDAENLMQLRTDIDALKKQLDGIQKSIEELKQFNRESKQIGQLPSLARYLNNDY